MKDQNELKYEGRFDISVGVQVFSLFMILMIIYYLIAIFISGAEMQKTTTDYVKNQREMSFYNQLEIASDRNYKFTRMVSNFLEDSILDEYVANMDGLAEEITNIEDTYLEKIIYRTLVNSNIYNYIDTTMIGTPSETFITNSIGELTKPFDKIAIHNKQAYLLDHVLNGEISQYLYKVIRPNVLEAITFKQAFDLFEENPANLEGFEMFSAAQITQTGDIFGKNDFYDTVGISPNKIITVTRFNVTIITNTLAEEKLNSNRLLEFGERNQENSLKVTYLVMGLLIFISLSTLISYRFNFLKLASIEQENRKMRRNNQVDNQNKNKEGD